MRVSGRIRDRRRRKATINVFAQSDDDAPIGTQAVAQVTIAPQPGGVVYPWQQVDVGAVAQAGSTTYSNGVYTVNASGADIWGNADEFRASRTRPPATVRSSSPLAWTACRT